MAIPRFASAYCDGEDPSLEEIFYGDMIIAAVALTLEQTGVKVVK
ncbi:MULTISPECIES: hypothetical protein [Arthrobacter]|uniref:Uncharacterized protein n=1 Tax=Arthrobacter bambusae TaxID=1338426 RepID=A0AAW8DK09_9MICC|nr:MULTISPECIES: hypothetical protein [Arthrobacter]MDP9907294.1 hypothetical protein [Arthrobacter bambusae]MDQ0131430.1 hypothetical protein [Arthrobacter bambusae]MDQ0182764.1 hypothetical protein [Arthrobacter bambusae]